MNIWAKYGQSHDGFETIFILVYQHGRCRKVSNLWLGLLANTLERIKDLKKLKKLNLQGY